MTPEQFTNFSDFLGGVLLATIWIRLKYQKRIYAAAAFGSIAIMIQLIAALFWIPASPVWNLVVDILFAIVGVIFELTYVWTQRRKQRKEQKKDGNVR